MNKNVISILAVAVLLVTGLTLHAQEASSTVANYQLIIENQNLSSPNTFEFDLEILDTDPRNPFELALFQAGITVNPEFFAGGKVTASIVEGSSQLVDEQQPQSILFAMDASAVKIPSRTLRPLPKDDKGEKKRGTIISGKIPGTRICRIRLTNTVPFTKAPANLKFNFSKIPYPTSVSLYIDGINTPLSCNEKYAIVKL